MAAELEQLRVSLVAELVGREAFEQLKREVNQVKAATASLDTTQTNLRKTTDAAAGAIRQQRQAFAQTGMQINQFAGQIAAGTSPMVAFVQQIGDVSYVLGQAGGALGRFGSFLSGPWGTAILIGISVLGPLIAKLMESKDAAEEAKSAFESYIESISTTTKIADAFTENSRTIAETRGKVAQLTKELLTLSNTPIEFKGEAAYAAAKTATESRIMQIKKEISAGQDLIQQKEYEIKNAIQLARLSEKRKASEDAIGKRKSNVGDDAVGSAKKMADEIDAVSQQVNSNLEDIMKNLGEYSRNYSATVSDSVRISIDAFNEQQKMQEELKNYNFAENMEKALKPIERMKSMSEAMGQAFSDGIKGMITGAMSFKQVMGNVLDAVINKLFEMFVVQQITGFIAQGISGITGIKLPGKAIGGPVQGGKAYMVGERGPEMFVPSRSGSIVPNSGMGGSMVVNVDARGASDPAAVRQQVELGIAQAAPYIIAAAQNRTLKTAGRTRLPGTIG